MAPRVANWLPKFNVWYPFFQPWGPIQGHKVQHLLVTWGQISSWIQPWNAVRHNSLLCVSTRNLKTLNPKPLCLSFVKLFVQTFGLFLVSFFSPLLTNLKVFKGLGFASFVYVYLLLALALHYCESQVLSCCKPDGEIITLQLGWRLFNLPLLWPCCFRATFICCFLIACQ